MDARVYTVARDQFIRRLCPRLSFFAVLERFRLSLIRKRHRRCCSKTPRKILSSLHQIVIEAGLCPAPVAVQTTSGLLLRCCTIGSLSLHDISSTSQHCTSIERVFPSWVVLCLGALDLLVVSSAGVTCRELVKVRGASLCLHWTGMLHTRQTIANR